MDILDIWDTLDIHASGALVKLDISGNYRCMTRANDSHQSEEFIRPIASMLKANTSITDLDLSKNNLNAEAAKILSEDIQDNGALAKLTFSGDYSFSKPVTVETGMTEADFSDKGLDEPGAIILAAWIQHK